MVPWLAKAETLADMVARHTWYMENGTWNLGNAASSDAQLPPPPRNGNALGVSALPHVVRGSGGGGAAAAAEWQVIPMLFHAGGLCPLGCIFHARRYCSH